MYRVSFLVQLALFLVTGLSLLAIGYNLLLLWDILAFWMIVCSIIAGLLIGTGASHLYVRSGVHRWAEKLRKFRWSPVMLVAGLLLASGALVTMRIVGP